MKTGAGKVLSFGEDLFSGVDGGSTSNVVLECRMQYVFLSRKDADFYWICEFVKVSKIGLNSKEPWITMTLLETMFDLVFKDPLFDWIG